MMEEDKEYLSDNDDHQQQEESPRKDGKGDEKEKKVRIREILSRFLKWRPSPSDMLERNILRGRVDTAKSALKMNDAKKKLMGLLGHRTVSKSKQTFPIFGISPTALADMYPGQAIPRLLAVSFAYLEKNLDFVGLFRITGSHLQITTIRSDVESGNYESLEACTAPQTITGIVGLFFRSLPEPIIPYALYDEFLKVTSLPTEAEKIAALIALIERLPPANNRILNSFMCLLHKVHLNAAVNMMGSTNLGLVWGPTLLQSSDPSQSLLGPSLTQSCNVVGLMVLQQNAIFPHESPSTPFLTPATAPIPIATPEPTGLLSTSPAKNIPPKVIPPPRSTPPRPSPPRFDPSPLSLSDPSSGVLSTSPPLSSVPPPGPRPVPPRPPPPSNGPLKPPPGPAVIRYSPTPPISTNFARGPPVRSSTTIALMHVPDQPSDDVAPSLGSVSAPAISLTSIPPPPPRAPPVPPNPPPPRPPRHATLANISYRASKTLPLPKTNKPDVRPRPVDDTDTPNGTSSSGGQVKFARTTPPSGPPLPNRSGSVGKKAPPALKPPKEEAPPQVVILQESSSHEREQPQELPSQDQEPPNAPRPVKPPIAKGPPMQKPPTLKQPAQALPSQELLSQESAPEAPLPSKPPARAPQQKPPALRLPQESPAPESAQSAKVPAKAAPQRPQRTVQETPEELPQQEQPQPQPLTQESPVPAKTPVKPPISKQPPLKPQRPPAAEEVPQESLAKLAGPPKPQRPEQQEPSQEAPKGPTTKPPAQKPQRPPAQESTEETTQEPTKPSTAKQPPKPQRTPAHEPTDESTHEPTKTPVAKPPPLKPPRPTQECEEPHEPTQPQLKSAASKPPPKPQRPQESADELPPQETPLQAPTTPTKSTAKPPPKPQRPQAEDQDHAHEPTKTSSKPPPKPQRPTAQESTEELAPEQPAKVALFQKAPAKVAVSQKPPPVPADNTAFAKPPGRRPPAPPRETKTGVPG